MTLFLLNNNLYEINDALVDVYDITTGQNISQQNNFSDIFKLPETSIDAALNWGDGKVYFFKADNYYKYDTASNTCDAGYPQKIAANWNGLWSENIWACMRNNDKAYFFAGENYDRYDCVADKVDDGYPQSVSQNWKGIPASITGIVMLNNKYALIQNNSDYYLYDWGADTVVNNKCYPLTEVLKLSLNGNASNNDAQPNNDPSANNTDDLSQMETDANTAIETLKAKKSSAYLGGDSAGGKKIGTFPDWFGNLQDLLTQSTTWGDDEENAQKLLQKYVNYYYTQKGVAMPPNVAVFIRYIGRGEANKNANEKIKDTPNAGQLGAITQADQDAGRGKRYQWCQAASSNAVNIALKENGYSLTTGSMYTAQWYKENNDRIITGKASWDATLEGGDMFSVVSNKTALSGHVMTAMEDNTDTIIAVSGNAGGKAIRIEEVKRGMPPAAFNWGNYYDDTKPKQPGVNQPIENGEVWIVSIQKTSLINHLDITDNDELKQYGLKKL